jgi:RNA polymerase II subunit A-like phosphatase
VRGLFSSCLGLSNQGIDDFFVGIGDINSTFLPKVDPTNALMNAANPPPPHAASAEATPPAVPVSVEPPQADEPPAAGSTSPLSPAEEASLVQQNEAALEAQVEKRPLAKLQEELTESVPAEPPTIAPDTSRVSSGPKADNSQPKHARKALLKNDDTELQRVKKVRTTAPLRIVSYIVSSSSTTSIDNSTTHTRSER